MELARRNNSWDPFETLHGLQLDLDRAFGRNGFQAGFAPLIDFREEDDRYVVHADLPGVKKEEISISVEGNSLTLKGERKGETERKEKGYHYSERRYGSFERTVEFPAEIDSEKIKAAFKDGVLEIAVPKAETVKPRQIKVE